MSSTNKTQNLGLNDWIASDCPKRMDFVNDNQIIDRAFTEHKNDSTAHITEAERKSWNTMIHHGVYFGNGSSLRTITTECPFLISFGIVFADGRPASVIHFDDGRKYNYIGFFGSRGNGLGVKLLGDGISFQISQSSGAEIENEYMNLNEAGVGYQYILFR